MRSINHVTKVSLLTMVLLLEALPGARASTAARQDRAGAVQRTLTGVVSDAMCGRTHMIKGKSDAECLRECVRQGAKYALVSGKDVYTLVGHEAELDRYAAQRVTVKGRVNGATVAVDSVAPAKEGARP